MSAILIPVLVVAVIGLIAGIGLSVASIIMAVPVDEKAMAVRDVLPGANCGACGYSGCDGYAKALADGTAKNGLCAPGGTACANDIAAILGVAAGEIKAKTAVVKCNGTCDKTGKAYKYDGVKSCAAINMIYSGDGKCSYGCLGLGDCIKACPNNAISICNGVAVINASSCIACGQCVSRCPKNLIEIVSGDSPAVVFCSNKDKGGQTRKQCSAGCIGCMRCEKTCTHDAIKVSNFVAYIDSDNCIGCGDCVSVCPSNCIDLLKIKQLQNA